MQQSSDLLGDIKQLFEGGEHQTALDLLDLYLGDYPNDPEAEVLKVEFLLELDKDAATIGLTLAHLAAVTPDGSRFATLQGEVETRVSRLLANGRQTLRRGSFNDALKLFDDAVALLPTDPAIPLAAGLALLRHGTNSHGQEEDGPFDSLFSRQRTPTSERGRKPYSEKEFAAQTEKYLQRAIERSQPDHATFAQAARLLLRHRLQTGDITEALVLLGSLTAQNIDCADIAADLGEQVLEASLDNALTLLRAGEQAVADGMLAGLLEHLPDLAVLHLARAESLLQMGQLTQALTAYRAAQRATGEPTLAPEAARQVWAIQQGLSLTCGQCGKRIELRETECSYCGTSIARRELLVERFHLEDTPEKTVAQVGIAYVLNEQGHPDRAARQLDTVIPSLLDEKALTAVRAFRQDVLPVSATAPEPSAGERLAAHWMREGLTDGVLAEIRHLTAQQPTAWRDIPLQQRLTLVRAVLASDDFALTQALLQTVFQDNPARKRVAQLRNRFTQALTAWSEAQIELADQTLATGRTEDALELITTVLRLMPDQARAYLLRAQVRQAANQAVLALQDYRSVLALPQLESHLQLSARLGAARILEAQGEFEQALALLEGQEDEEAAPLRARLMRRVQGIPAIHIERRTAVVMHDTLACTETAPYYQGFLAVAVRAASRAGTASTWINTALNAGYEFVQVLGGLRNFVGDPVFALRLISQPHPQIAERGQLTLALMTRVSAPTEAGCQNLALDLWRTIQAILPLAQEHVYSFEPVVDEQELAALLRPFEAAALAEIVRREDASLIEGNDYAVYPFTPGSLDLHNLCWTLLRQPAPAMVSIHLLPTDVMPWERTALDRLMLNESETAETRSQGDSGDPALDSVAQWWNASSRWDQAHANRSLIDTLRAQAYVLRVNVASAAGGGPLLPDIVAAALFGPLQSNNGLTGGGYEIMRASTGEEAATAWHNLTALEVEAWVYSAAPERAPRLRHLVGEREAALAFRLPLPGSHGVPGLPSLDAKPIAPPPGLPTRGTVLGESIARINGLPLRITQAIDDRRRHAYVVGKTGTGKSTLLQNMALQDIENGLGVGVIDPHGDLIEDILTRIPAERANDVILFDPSDEEYPIGLNLLDARSESEKQRIVTEFIGLLIRMYDPHEQGIVGPRFQHNVRNAMLTVMAVEGSTLIEVVRALTDHRYVQRLLPEVKDPLVRNYWTNQIANTSDFHKSEILDYIVSKFSRFVGDSRIRNIVGQRTSTLDFRQIMDRRQILLVNLSKGKIGPESAQFLGLLLVQRLLMTALSRADTPVAERPDFYLYVDEFQNFATDLFSTVLSEGRKYGLAVTVANQYLTQLSHETREAIFGNIGSVVSFRLGTQDAAVLAPELYPVFGVDDLLNLPKYTACVKLLVEGVAARPFTMRTVPNLRPIQAAQAAAIREASRQAYGRPVSTVEADVMKRFEK